MKKRENYLLDMPFPNNIQNLSSRFIAAYSLQSRDWASGFKTVSLERMKWTFNLLHKNKSEIRLCHFIDSRGLFATKMARSHLWWRGGRFGDIGISDISLYYEWHHERSGGKGVPVDRKMRTWHKSNQNGIGAIRHQEWLFPPMYPGEFQDPKLIRLNIELMVKKACTAF